MDWDERLDRARALIFNGLYHAAFDELRDLEDQADEQDDEKRAAFYDEQGKLSVYLTDYKRAVALFLMAISCTRNKDTWVKYNVHLAVAYRRLSEFDTSYRYLNLLLEFENEVSAETRGLLYLNLSAVQGIHGFYDQSIISAYKSLESFSLVINSGSYLVDLYNNLGLAHLENGTFEQAEDYLNRALALSDDQHLDIISEMGRLNLLRGRILEGMQNAEAALRLVWSRIINYDKEEIARLCQWLAQISMQFHEVDLAIRLNEKAQLFFGQLGMWRQWQDIDAVVSEWTERTKGCMKTPPETNLSGISFHEIRFFLITLDAINSQELIDKKISALLDVRVHYVKLLADPLGLSNTEKENLILAARLADYGLTALEHELVLCPDRSVQAYEQYKRHPWLSASMAQAIQLEAPVIEIITDHHEHLDGTGFPQGKQANEICFLAKVLRIIDAYTYGVAIDHKTHAECLHEIMSQCGTWYDETIAREFSGLFTINALATNS
ncbi:HD domain-containing phosphohydrolase [Ferroacidibacillus organovorans]|uniref:HD-GYP domain-containing protein n=1 Tax=Ferroacidibacillus organovorans TaxID=1765683 RepID=A0A101XPT9_9BACL|nr:HD domain-containing phosphohydrolase [Ferroacidibacillus organovorans]KUO95387.1 hypothetical protein ATW55_11070 [Ferroacidibacillus organovorans]